MDSRLLRLAAIRIESLALLVEGTSLTFTLGEFKLPSRQVPEVD